MKKDKVQHLRNIDFSKAKLDKLTCFIQDGTHSTPNYVAFGIPFYSVETIVNDDFSHTKCITEEEHDEFSKRCPLMKNDILMTRIGDIGTPKIIDWIPKASIYVSLALLRTNDRISSKYLTQYIQTPYFRKELWKYMLHTATPKKINLGEIKKCEVRYPVEISVQNSIAIGLGFLDKKIKLLERKIMNLKLFNKGLSYRLLYNEDPQTEASITELFAVETGTKNNQDKDDNAKYPFYVRSEKFEHIGNYSYDEEAILIPGEGKIGEIYHYIDGKFEVHQRVYKISGDNKKCMIKFVYYYMRIFFKKHALSFSSKATVDSLRMIVFDKFNIPIIPIDQQKKITKQLDLVSQKISFLEEKLNESKLFKKGLLQKLFL